MERYQIEEVENGFVIYEGAIDLRTGYQGKRCVAHTMEDVGTILMDLFDEACAERDAP